MADDKIKKRGALSNYDKACTMLKSKGVTDEQINQLIGDKEKPEDKFKALGGLLGKYDLITLKSTVKNKGSKKPTCVSISEFFGDEIAKLLIEVKAYKEFKLSENNIPSIDLKSATNEQLKLALEFKSNEEKFNKGKELKKELLNKLIEFGIIDKQNEN